MKKLNCKPVVSMRDLEKVLGYRRQDILRIASHSGRYYETFQIESDSGKIRVIHKSTGILRTMQLNLYRRFMSGLELPDGIHGCVPGSSTVLNANCHLGRPEVVRVDLRDCYPNISSRDVYRAFASTIRCSTAVSELLTKLTTFKRKLPQGPPTSPAIANVVLLPLFQDLRDLAAEFGLEVTLYVDDICISGPGASRIIEPATDLVRKHGQVTAWRKLMVMPASGRQTVTGLVVNRKPSVSRDYREEVRRSIIDLVKRGNITHRERQSVMGKIAYVAGIAPSHGRRLHSFAERVLPSSSGMA